MPCQAKANGLELDHVQAELNDLTALERQLLAPRIPFMKLVNLPRGKQRSLHGLLSTLQLNLTKYAICYLVFQKQHV